MKHKVLFFMYFFSVILFASANNVLGTNGISAVNQDEQLAKKTAQEFVAKMQLTRDVTPLTREMFLPNFVSHFKSDDEIMPSQLYSQLTDEEKSRLFAVKINAAYLQVIDAVWRPERKYVGGKEASDWSLKSILPSAIAEKVKNTIWTNDKYRFTNYQNFQVQLPEMEEVLAEARTHLIKKRLEQTPEFQKKLNDMMTRIGVNYHVTSITAADSIDGNETLIGFPDNQKFYRVDTPLFMSMILVKAGNQMKIVTVTSVEDD